MLRSEITDPTQKGQKQIAAYKRLKCYTLYQSAATKMARPYNENGQQESTEEKKATAISTKARGRPRSRWIDELEEDLKKLGIQN